MAQSVFVAPEYLETTFVQNRFVDSIYIDANLEQSYVLAVIIPNKSTCIHWFKREFLKNPISLDDDFKNISQKEWEEIISHPKLKGFLIFFFFFIF